MAGPHEELLRNLKIGATGEFPEGKIDDTDEGALNMMISHGMAGEEKLVRIDFGKPTAWLALPPDVAIGLAELLIKHAKAVERGE